MKDSCRTRACGLPPGVNELKPRHPSPPPASPPPEPRHAPPEPVMPRPNPVMPRPNPNMPLHMPRTMWTMALLLTAECATKVCPSFDRDAFLFLYIVTFCMVVCSF